MEWHIQESEEDTREEEADTVHESETDSSFVDGEHLTSQDDLRLVLETSRRELLDLGLRNTLLNYRSLRSRGVDADAVPTDVYRLLVTEKKQLRFLPLQEDGTPPPAGSETYIQTRYVPQELVRS